MLKRDKNLSLSSTNNNFLFSKSIYTLSLNPPVRSFFMIFQKYNDLLWIDYQKGKIKKEKLKWWRFYLCLKDVGVEEKSLAEDLDNYYLSEAPKKTKLIEGTIDLLNYLVPDYSLHIITNGFNEVQFLKLDNSKLTRFFQTIITSELLTCQLGIN